MPKPYFGSHTYRAVIIIHCAPYFVLRLRRRQLHLRPFKGQFAAFVAFARLAALLGHHRRQPCLLIKFKFRRHDQRVGIIAARQFLLAVLMKWPC